jgi:hypothetical protein
MKPVFRGAVAFFIFCLAASVVRAANGVEKVSWSEMPKAVQKLAHAHIVRHGKAQKSVEGENVFYDMEGKKNGKHVELSASADGKLIWLDEEIEFTNAPGAVQAAMRKIAAPAKIETIHKVRDDGDLSFVADVSVGEKNLSLEFGDDGVLQSTTEDLTWSQIPLAAQKMAKAQIGTNEIVSLSKVTEDKEVRFVVDYAKNGVEQELSVSPQGDLLEMEIALEETPAATQKTIKENLGGGKITEINRTSEEGEIFYDVDFETGSTTKFMSVAATGELVSVEEEISFTSVPAVAQKAIQSNLNGRSLASVTRRVEDGETFYDISASKEGRDEEFTISESGDLVDDE